MISSETVNDYFFFKLLITKICYTPYTAITNNGVQKSYLLFFAFSWHFCASQTTFNFILTCVLNLATRRGKIPGQAMHQAKK